jgi:hypothetical protein
MEGDLAREFINMMLPEGDQVNDNIREHRSFLEKKLMEDLTKGPIRSRSELISRQHDAVRDFDDMIKNFLSSGSRCLVSATRSDERELRRPCDPTQ